MSGSLLLNANAAIFQLHVYHGEVYSIQHYVIKFVGFSGYSAWFPPPIKTDRHDIAEIFLKVALITITPYYNIK